MTRTRATVLAATLSAVLIAVEVARRIGEMS